MRILIADDEEEIREYIHRMPHWQEAGCEIIGKAANGREALELLDRLKPDLLITDIRMPVMSGLELAQRIKEEGREVPVILLTAFGDFEYARQAIKLGVVDFITKPFQPEAIVQSVRILQQHVSKRKEWLWQDEFFALFGDGQNAEGQLKAWMSLHDVKDGSYYLLFADIDDESAVNGGPPLSRLGLKDKIETIFKNEGYVYWTALPKSGIYFTLFTGEGRMQETASGLVMDIARTIMAECNDNPSSSSISLGISGWSASLLQFSEAVRQIEHCMEYRMLLGKRSMIAYESLDQRFLSRTRHKQLIGDEVAELLHKGSWEEIQRFLRAAYKKMLLDGFHKIEIRNLNLHMIEAAESVLQQYGIAPSAEERVAVREQALTCNVLTDLMQLFERYFQRVLAQIAGKKEDFSSRLVFETKQEIEKRYADDLTLQMIADQLNVNYSYLSRVIKKETGKNFRDLLWEHRLKEATSRLIQTDMKTYEIAYAVGFKDVNHFGEIFKKRLGKTPTEFKEEARRLPTASGSAVDRGMS
ncbi:response regulator transcription factor [Paenibacillus nasutitermitis]|uniref:Response regulator n=1 Tax=Paenibacillus nasutitermitis TaxID=1652958 RepID=A0A917DQI7_9BACL|nr:response regulator [Paenibacillus nasutitermitis]GGD57197.1 hypothetical protein GCM10010911_13730 [Paenibacillus nasutitermitis]